MDIDNAEKKKENKKGGWRNKNGKKEVNAADTDKNKKKHCHICGKETNHVTADCYFNAKNKDSNEKRKEWEKENKQKEEKNKSSKKKEIRAASNDSDSDDASDNEKKTPSSSKQANSAHTTAYIEEVTSDEDERSGTPPPKDKGKGKMKQKGQDFFRRTM
jgi:hypothetical protein